MYADIQNDLKKGQTLKSDRVHTKTMCRKLGHNLFGKNTGFLISIQNIYMQINPYN